jgi:DnaJ-class molecular chaperone
MTHKEAFRILGIDENSTPDDIKKAWRSLAAKYHPDVYKDDGGMFKKVTEAYNLVKDGGFSIFDVFGARRNTYNAPPFPGSDEHDAFFRDFFSKQRAESEDRVRKGRERRTEEKVKREERFAIDIEIDIVLTYSEFINGCTRMITYSRLTKKNTQEEISLKLKIPEFASRIKASNKGHWKSGTTSNPVYTDVYFNIAIDDHKFMVVKEKSPIPDGDDIITLYVTERTSLLSAVLGHKIRVDLEFMKLDIKLPELTRHHDLIEIDVEDNYFDKVIIELDVYYPDNIKEIV